MTTDPSQTTLRRSDAYRLFAACFYEPEREVFLEEKLCANLAGLMEEICPAAVGECREMEHCLRTNSQEEILQEYSALFLGPFTILAQPYGSIYLDKEYRLMGDSTMEVVKFYRRHGLEPELKDAPDHICFELEFLSYLAAREAEALKAGDSAVAADYRAQQREFLGCFLAPWIPAFCDRIRANSNNDFYKSLADCLQKCLGAVEKTLQEG